MRPDRSPIRDRGFHVDCLEKYSRRRRFAQAATGVEGAIGAMPSPFPGMNPYLERDIAWHDFHERFLITGAVVIGA
jgi:hypothetical protein